MTIVALAEQAHQALDRNLDAAIARTETALRRAQHADGHFVFELEADATIPAEYVLLRIFRDEPRDETLELKIAAYLRRIQGPDGGWPLFHGGTSDISASVKAYLALKAMGDDPARPHMVRARVAILARGGATQVNVFTRILLALFGIVGWKAVPVMPVEIMLLPAWFPFHLAKMSYWARTVIVPLLVLQLLKPLTKVALPLDELFLEPPQRVGPPHRAPHQGRGWFALFRGIDVALRLLMPWAPRRLQAKAVARARHFVEQRLNGHDGLGAIFPAMVNATLMFDALNEPRLAAIARESVERLVVVGPGEAYCQPCVSPVWDTVLASHALLEAGGAENRQAAIAALDWLLPHQVMDVRGDWAVRRPAASPGGWAFQYANPHYPDLDDTAAIVMAMDRARRAGLGPRYDRAIAAAVAWIVGLQSRNGGWAAFDADNEADYLNNIPFADHGALIDPPTEDVTARCVAMLNQLPEPEAFEAARRRGVDFLLARQAAQGSWYGRWGVNHIYGTWSVAAALQGCRGPAVEAARRRAAAWLLAIQNGDGGWGEDCGSYRLDYRAHAPAASTASQTAWALLALMACGEADHPALTRGVAYLVATQRADGFWHEPQFTGTGFPRVFYLRYHGYSKYFPLWALARYRNLRHSPPVDAPAWGI